MSEAVRVYIERVKAALSVTTDEDLAAKIGYSKQAIANWRRRDGIPHRAELRIVGILGDDFSIRTPNLATKRVKWDDITHGLAILAVEQYTSHWPRPLSYEHARAIGWRFEKLEDRLRNLLRAYSAQAENPDQVIDALVDMIKEKRDDGIDKILSVFLTTDMPTDDFKAVPYWFRNPSG